MFLFILLKNKHLQTEETDRHVKDHFNLLPWSRQIYEVWYKLEGNLGTVLSRILLYMRTFLLNDFIREGQ